MKIKSKDISAREAIEAIGLILTADEINEYTQGESRITVLEAAVNRIKELSREPEGATESPTDPDLDVPGVIFPEPVPSHDSFLAESTKKWVKTMPALQPKEGEVLGMTDVVDAGLKGGVVQKAATLKTLTIIDGVPCWAFFDDKGNRIAIEKVPGH
jgi:hypothetical protein